MGVRLRRVRDDELWRAGGFELDDYAERGIDVSHDRLQADARRA
jgi:hypothetical protein